MTTPKRLHPALRQYQHNNCTGLVMGFDYDETVKIVTELERRLALMWAWMEEQERHLPFTFADDNPDAADWFTTEGRVK